MQRQTLIAGLSFTLSAAAIGQTPWVVTPTDWFYNVDGVVQPLGMETSSVACFQDGVVSPAVAATALSGHGLDLDTVFASSSPGWMYARFLDSTQTPETVATAVRAMAASADIDFVSPVFLAGTLHLPWIVTRDIIVAFDTAATDNQVKRVLETIPGGVIERDLGGLPGVILIETDLKNAFEVLALVDRIDDHPMVRYAQTDAIWWAKPMSIPNDPLFPQLWGLNQANDQDMDAPEAWDITMGDPNVLVGILDDGLDQDHPDMNQIPGFNFTGSGSTGDHVTACDGHGTCVASCVSATIDNNLGTVGVAPECRTIGLKIFNGIEFFGFCLGFLESQDSWTINGINQCVTSGASASNSSWGGGGSSSGINNAFDAARSAGVLHIAAAGNDGSTTISWPASHASLLAISALSSNGSLASFSTHGNGLFCAAPGEGIWCADAVGNDGFSNGDTVQISGTSFASPYVAGVAALVFSRDNSLTPAEVEDILMETCVDIGSSGWDISFGYGFVNAKAAVDAVDGGTTCDGDANGDGVVDVADILLVIKQYGPCPGCSGDFDGDDVVGVNDILILIAAYGSCD